MMKNRKAALMLIACLCLAAAGSVQAADKDNGKKLFDAKCSLCHGKDAKGNAAMQKSMKLPDGALNLTDKNPADFAPITTNGKNKMPAYKSKVKASDIDDMADYVASLNSDGGTQTGKTEAKAEAAAKPAVDLAASKKIYDKKCASCHGKDGKGNAGLAKSLKLAPALLELNGKATMDKTDEDLSAVTAKGQGKMPSYADKLSSEEIDGLTGYIRSFAPQQENKKSKDAAAQ